MPFTPFHLGPVLLLWSLFFSLDLIALFVAATIIDIEGFLHLLGIYPVFHGALHSFFGATIIAIVATVISYEAQNALNPEFKQKANFGNIFVSGLFGAYSHIILDACMYSDLNLAWPLGWWNPFLGMVDQSKIIEFCIITFIAGVLIFILRKVMWADKK